jgi:hypothetical protein
MQQYQLYKLSTLINTSLFYQQRDADLSRIDEIIGLFKQRIRNNVPLIDIPIVLVVDKNNDICLLDKTNKRVNKCIVDGQHRVLAMKTLLEENSSIANINIPCFENLVNSIQEASNIQYSLFNQKPVDLIDKYTKSNNYSIGDEIRDCSELLEQYNNNYTGLKFVDKRYSDCNQKRKSWFMRKEFEYYIRNSLNVEKWNERHIKGQELYNCIIILATRKKDKLETNNNYKSILGISKKSNILTFNDKYKDNMLAYISYGYCNNYNKIVSDIEKELNIDEDYESAEESESE